MCNKSNKQLAVEIVIAMINANPRITRQLGNKEEFIPAHNSDQVINVINKIYNSLQELDKTQDTTTTQQEEN